MTDRNERLKSIRERLRAATPGPWNIERVDHEDQITFEIGTDAGFFAKIYESDFIENGRNAKPTCELIANAPSDIAYLLALVERYEKALETAIGALKRVDATGSWEGDFVIEAIEKCEALEAGERE